MVAISRRSWAAYCREAREGGAILSVTFNARGLMHFDIPLDRGAVATFHIPFPEDELDLWKIRRMLAWAEEYVDRIEIEEREKEGQA